MNNSSKKYIETSSGKAFYPYNPAAEQIDINDIAHAISQLCRFGGHSKQFYSVAQHSILVSKYLRDNGESPVIQLYGLLHDATEGYMVDLPTPIKQLLPDYRAAEDRLHDIIWEALGLQKPTEEEWKVVKNADIQFQNYEATILLPVASWADKTVKLDYELKEELISDVKAEFLSLYHQLMRIVKPTPYQELLKGSSEKERVSFKWDCVEGELI